MIRCKPSTTPKLTFSLWSLLLLVTFSAVAIGLTMAVGPSMLILVPIVPLALIGYVAHKTEKPVPFWQCVGAIAILFTLVPPLGYRLNESDAVVGSICFGLAAWLNFRAMVNGQLATKLLAIVVAVPFVYGFTSLTIHGIRNHKQILDFWWP